jgi:hypothetical protein
MVNKLPLQYVLSKFYAYAGDPSYNKYTNIYNGSCCICREGKSWLKKKRLYYYPTTNSFYCFNCHKSWTALNWVEEVSGLNREEIEEELISNDNSLDVTNILKNIYKPQHKKSPTLPIDSINIEDPQQISYYNTNFHFQKAREYIQQRLLDKAVNRSPHYYISLTDKIHKNRLCIPYYSLDRKIIFYQTRSLDDNTPRYLNKIAQEKTIFGIERISSDIPYIFLFEGPIDAMFTKNGIGLGGLTLTHNQQQQLQGFPFHDKIWILDNPSKDQAAKENVIKLLQRKEKVFKWPSDKPYKDFNEWAVRENLTEIPHQIIFNSLYFN